MGTLKAKQLQLFPSLEEAEQKMKEVQSILDGITEPLVLIDKQFKVKRVNKSTLQFTGISEFKEIVKKKCYSVLYGRDKICPYCPLINHKLEKEEEISSIDFLMFQKSSGLNVEILYKQNDKNLHLNLSFFPLEKDGKVYSVVENISNITAIKEKEEENLRMRNLASLGIMISGVAHELNNPLTGISLTVQNLQKSLSNFDSTLFENRLDLIQKDLARAALIVSDIISFAKPERSRPTLADLVDVVNKARDTVERLYPDLTKSIHWDIHYEDDHVFYFNPFKMERLFLNLFRNSIQAMDYKKGYIKVDIKKKKSSTSIVVEDDAGGIPDTIIDKIFDPFFTNRKEGTGTGLGLSICHSIVKEHNGKISVKSVENKTRFTISVPTRLQERK